MSDVDTVSKDGEEYLFDPDKNQNQQQQENQEQDEEDEQQEDESSPVDLPQPETREDGTITTNHPKYTQVIWDSRNGGLQK